jgi:hypothetical protein
MSGIGSGHETDSRWDGLRSTWDVGEVVEDISRVKDRLVTVEAEHPETGRALHLEHAVSGLALAVNAMFASADVKCTLLEPPEDVVTRSAGPDGDMITKCFHDPPHCWDGNGRRLKPCP